MLDYLYEMKTSRRNSTLDSQRFSSEETVSLFSSLKRNVDSPLVNENTVKPVEMESVHIDINNSNCKKGLFGIFKKNK